MLELIAGFNSPGIQSYQEQLGNMSSRIHPQARTTPKIRQGTKDSGLSSREAKAARVIR